MANQVGTVVDFEQIPPELRAIKQWVVWHYYKHPARAKASKVPVSFRTRKPCDHLSPASWTDADTALAIYKSYIGRGVDGIGFVVTRESGIVAVDMDDVLSSDVHPVVRDIIINLDTYTEISPSGKGVRMFVRAKLPHWGRRCAVQRNGEIIIPQFEIYDCDRFVTVTGNGPLTFVLERRNVVSSGVESRQRYVDIIHGKLFGTEPPEVKGDVNAVDDATGSVIASHLERDMFMSSERVKQMFSDFTEVERQLWRGRWQQTGRYPSQSEADMALVSAIARTFREPDKIDGLFRKSGLMRDKWSRVGLKYVIPSALAGLLDFKDDKIQNRHS